MTPESNAENWGSDFEQPQRKSRIPVLAWVLGAGCLFLLLILVVAIVAFTRLVGRASDPAVQWPAVAEVLPFDAPPENVRVIGWKWGGTHTWLMFPRGEADYQVLLLHVTGASAAATREKFFGGGAEVSTLVAQGRELPAVRAAGNPPELEHDAKWRDVIVKELASGPCLRLDLSQPGSPELLLLEWTEPDGEVPVDQERVLLFLEPFHLEQVR
jgi:hypothetical protein